MSKTWNAAPRNRPYWDAWKLSTEKRWSLTYMWFSEAQYRTPPPSNRGRVPFCKTPTKWTAVALRFVLMLCRLARWLMFSLLLGFCLFPCLEAAGIAFFVKGLTIIYEYLHSLAIQTPNEDLVQSEHQNPVGLISFDNLQVQHRSGRAVWQRVERRGKHTRVKQIKEKILKSFLEQLGERS